MRIPEELLHFIWRFKLYKPLQLKTNCGKSIQVIFPGEYNTHAGPDFLFAQLHIDEQQWFGHVELHVHAKDWELHRHQTDEAYNAVILHVVWTGSQSCLLADGTEVPNVQLEPLVNPTLLDKARDLFHNGHWLPCSYRLKHIPMHIKLQTIQGSAIERLECKQTQIMRLCEKFKGDWERVTFTLLAGAFGLKANKIAFMDLSELISLKLMGKNLNRSDELQAMLFGQAGFLQAYQGKDRYVIKLQAIYQFQKNTYKLLELPLFQWKFLRMRPQNFPTFKLAQLASMYTYSVSWFERLISSKDLEALKAPMRQITLPKFWRTHFHLQKTTSDHDRSFSEAFLDLLVINCFVPLLFTYAKQIKHTELVDRALDWLEKIEAESNSITRKYRKEGLPSYSALDSQGLLHLQSNYCDQKRCLECPIGMNILQLTSNS